MITELLMFWTTVDYSDHELGQSNEEASNKFACMIIMLCYLCLGVIKEPLAKASSVLKLCLFCYSFSTHFFNFIFVRLPLLHAYNKTHDRIISEYNFLLL